MTTINVTQHHIDMGDCRKCCSCPVALSPSASFAPRRLLAMAETFAPTAAIEAAAATYFEAVAEWRQCGEVNNLADSIRLAEAHGRCQKAKEALDRVLPPVRCWYHTRLGVVGRKKGNRHWLNLITRAHERTLERTGV